MRITRLHFIAIRVTLNDNFVTCCNGVELKEKIVKADSYKHAYPRTLLADVLALLMERRRIDFAELERFSGVNRGTIHKIVAARRSCEPDMRKSLLLNLVIGDGHAQRLSDLFDGQSEQILSIPELVTTLEPPLAATRQQAVLTGLDIGALCGRYSLSEIYSDALALEQAGKWSAACRWASYMVAVARRRGNTQKELSSGLFHARLLMASSRFTESRNTLERIIQHPMLTTADCMTEETAALIRIQAGVYLGWLNYEIGDYTSAIRCLDTAIALIATLGPVGCDKDRSCCTFTMGWLSALRELDVTEFDGPYAVPSDIFNLALHLRGKALAERAMYVPAYMNPLNIRTASQALAKSAAVCGFLGYRGMLGHCLLWMARLAAVRAANIATGVSPSLITTEDDQMLRQAEMPAARLLAKYLNSECDPKNLLSLASGACFGAFQSSSLNRGYYQRAKAAVRALEGNLNGALASFEDAYL